MAHVARKSDGRRIFTDAFKHKQISRVWRGEVTLADLSRKLGIARSLLQRWKRFVPREGAESPGPARPRAPAASDPGTTRYVAELQRLLGKQTVELELLRAELDTLRRERRFARTSKG